MSKKFFHSPDDTKLIDASVEKPGQPKGVFLPVIGSRVHLDRSDFHFNADAPRAPLEVINVGITHSRVKDAINAVDAESATPEQIKLIQDTFIAVATTGLSYLTPIFRSPSSFVIRADEIDSSTVRRSMDRHVVRLGGSQAAYEKVIVPRISDDSVELIEMITNVASINGVSVEIYRHIMTGKYAERESLANGPPVESVSTTRVITDLVKLVGVQPKNAQLRKVIHTELAPQNSFLPDIQGIGAPTTAHRMGWLLMMIEWAAISNGPVQLPFAKLPANRVYDLGRMWQEVKSSLLNRMFVITLSSSEMCSPVPRNVIDRTTMFLRVVPRVLPYEVVQKAMQELRIGQVGSLFPKNVSTESSSSAPKTGTVDWNNLDDKQLLLYRLQHFVITRLCGDGTFIDTNPQNVVNMKIYHTQVPKEWEADVLGKFVPKADVSTVAFDTVAGLMHMTKLGWPFTSILPGLNKQSLLDRTNIMLIGKAEHVKFKNIYPSRVVNEVQNFYKKALKQIEADSLTVDKGDAFFAALSSYVRGCRGAFLAVNGAQTPAGLTAPFVFASEEYAIPEAIEKASTTIVNVCGQLHVFDGNSYKKYMESEEWSGTVLSKPKTQEKSLRRASVMRGIAFATANNIKGEWFNSIKFKVDEDKKNPKLSVSDDHVATVEFPSTNHVFSSGKQSRTTSISVKSKSPNIKTFLTKIREMTDQAAYAGKLSFLLGVGVNNHVRKPLSFDAAIEGAKMYTSEAKSSSSSFSSSSSSFLSSSATNQRLTFVSEQLSIDENEIDPDIAALLSSSSLSSSSSVNTRASQIPSVGYWPWKIDDPEYKKKMAFGTKDSDRKLLATRVLGPNAGDDTWFSTAGSGLPHIGKDLDNFSPEYTDMKNKLKAIDPIFASTGYYETAVWAFYAHELLSAILDETRNNKPLLVEIMKPMFPTTSDSNTIYRYTQTMKSELFPIFNTSSSVANSAKFVSGHTIEEIEEIYAHENYDENEPDVSSLLPLDIWLRSVMLQHHGNDSPMHKILFNTIKKVVFNLFDVDGKHRQGRLMHRIDDYFESVESFLDVEEFPLATQSSKLTEYATLMNELVDNLVGSTVNPDSPPFYIYQPAMLLRHLFDASIIVARSLHLYVTTQTVYINHSAGSAVEAMLISAKNAVEDGRQEENSNFAAHVSRLTAALSSLQLGSDGANYSNDLVVQRPPQSRKSGDTYITVFIDQTRSVPRIRSAMIKLLADGDHRPLCKMLLAKEGETLAFAKAQIIKERMTTTVEKMQTRVGSYLAGVVDAELDRLVPTEFRPTLENDISVSRELSKRLAYRIKFADFIVTKIITDSNSRRLTDSLSPDTQVLLKALATYSYTMYALAVNRRVDRVYWAGLGDTSPRTITVTRDSVVTRRRQLETMTRIVSNLVNVTPSIGESNKFKQEAAKEFLDAVKSESVAESFMTAEQTKKFIADLSEKRDALKAQGGSQPQQLIDVERALLYLQYYISAPSLEGEGVRKRKAIDSLVESTRVFSRLYSEWKSDWEALSDLLTTLSLIHSDFVGTNENTARLNLLKTLDTLVRNLLVEPMSKSPMSVQKQKAQATIVFQKTIGAVRNLQFTGPTGTTSEIILSLLNSITIEDSSATLLENIQGHMSSSKMINLRLLQWETTLPPEEHASLMFFSNLIGNDSDVLVSRPPQLAAVDHVRNMRQRMTTEALVNSIRTGVEAGHPRFVLIQGSTVNAEITSLVHKFKDAPLVTTLTTWLLKYILSPSAPESSVRLGRLIRIKGNYNAMYFEAVMIDSAAASKYLEKLESHELFTSTTDTFIVVPTPQSSKVTKNKSSSSAWKDTDEKLLAVVQNQSLFYNSSEINALIQNMENRWSNSLAGGLYELTGSKIKEVDPIVSIAPLNSRDVPITQTTYHQWYTEKKNRRIAADFVRPLLDPTMAVRKNNRDKLTEELFKVINIEDAKEQERKMEQEDKRTGGKSEKTSTATELAEIKGEQTLIRKLEINVLRIMADPSYDVGTRLVGVHRNIRLGGAWWLKNHANFLSYKDVANFVQTAGVPLSIGYSLGKVYNNFWNGVNTIRPLEAFDVEREMSFGTVPGDQMVGKLLFASEMFYDALDLYPNLIDETFEDAARNRAFFARLRTLEMAATVIAKSPKDVKTLGYFGGYKGRLPEFSLPIDGKADMDKIMGREFIGKLSGRLFPVDPSSRYLPSGGISSGIPDIVKNVFNRSRISGLGSFVDVLSIIFVKVRQAYKEIPEFSTDSTIVNELQERAKIVLKERARIGIRHQLIVDPDRISSSVTKIEEISLPPNTTETNRLLGNQMDLEIVNFSAMPFLLGQDDDQEYRRAMNDIMTMYTTLSSNVKIAAHQGRLSEQSQPSDTIVVDEKFHPVIESIFRALDM